MMRRDILDGGDISKFHMPDFAYILNEITYYVDLGCLDSTAVSGGGGNSSISYPNSLHFVNYITVVLAVLIYPEERWMRA